MVYYKEVDISECLDRKKSIWNISEDETVLQRNDLT